MSRRKPVPIFASILLMASLAACAPGSTPVESEVKPTLTPRPTSTSAPAPTETFTPVPQPSATFTEPATQETTPQGDVYYVSPDGDDANAGSLEEPWRTIQHAAETLSPGETVYIRQGIYSEQVSPQVSGTPGNYITYAAYPGESPTIDGSNVSLPEWNGLFNIIGQSYIRVSGLNVINAGPGPHNPGILADTTSEIIIENNSVSHTSDSGIMAWGSQQVLIDGNEVEDACYGGYNESISVGESDGFEVRDNHVHATAKEGICIKDGSSNGSVHHNQVHDVKVGIYVDAWDKHTFAIEVHANIAYQNSHDGIAVASEMGGLLENVRLYNNIIYGNTFCGFSISNAGDSPDHPLKDVVFINNTLYHNGVEWGGGVCVGNGDAEGVVLRNNIVSQNLSFQMVDEEGLLAGLMVIDHNLIDGFRDYPGELYGDDAVTGDPLFANPEDADFRLLAGSPAIDAATDQLAPVLDFDGLTRPVDGDGNGAALPDIGAYEYNPLNSMVYPPILFNLYSEQALGRQIWDFTRLLRWRRL